MPLGDLAGIAVGSDVVALGAPLSIGVSDHLLGRVLDGFGRPIDGKGPLSVDRRAVRHGRTAAPAASRSHRRTVVAGYPCN